MSAAAQKPCVCLMLVFVLLISFWEAATSRTLSSTAVDLKQDSSADSLQSGREPRLQMEPESSTINEREGLRDQANNTPIGSGPPNCYLKCNGCIPCDPVFVALPPRDLTVDPQAANYLPQIWKCQCQSSFYDPWP